MTPEQIIELAKQAGFKTGGAVIRTIHSSGAWVGINGELQRFAQLVRNAALEEAAEVCGSKAPAIGNTNYGTACNECAGAIRSRKS